MPVVRISTQAKLAVVDITEEINQLLPKDADACLVFVPHTTAALVVNEGEPGLINDLLSMCENLLPSRNYEHNRIDNNAKAHLMAMLLGNSLVLPVDHGRLALGTWQRVLFVELDGPRERKVVVKPL